MYGMKALRRLARAAAALLLGSLLATAAQAQTGSTCLPEGTQASGAKYLICLPDAGHYNGQVVVFAHGYVDPRLPVGIPYDQLTLPDGSTLPQIVNQLGFGFAMSSYSMNGWAVVPGIADTLDVVNVYGAIVGTPSRVLLAGASEGGLIAAKSAETFPGTYAGALAVCGIVGDFPSLVNYSGQWRVLWDYYFPGMLPGSPYGVPQALLDSFESVWLPKIQAAIAANPGIVQDIAAAARIPYGNDPANLAAAVLDGAGGLVSVNDQLAKLNGQPFTNARTLYRGTSDDPGLNRGVARYTADAAAVAEMQAHYQTTGVLTVPVVTMHTTADPTVPFEQELMYQRKVKASGSSALHALIPVQRYGHCAFEPAELVAGFAILLRKVSGHAPTGAEAVLKTQQQRAAYRALLQQYR